MNWKNSIHSFDDRRNIATPGDREATLQFCVDHFIALAKKSIAQHGHFAVALSGGSTPKGIIEMLAEPAYSSQVDWNNIWFFWSDERCVPPFDPQSNYRMAMDAGLSKLHIPPENIHRMQAEGDPEEAAKAYDKLIFSKIPDGKFDLIMLGMGEDGHTASLFPKTHGLHTEGRYATANFVPEKNCWRITLTFTCINEARNIAVYVFGKAKKAILEKILNSPYEPDQLPAQRVGTPHNKALIIADKEALDPTLTAFIEN